MGRSLAAGKEAVENGSNLLTNLACNGFGCHCEGGCRTGPCTNRGCPPGIGPDCGRGA